MFLGGYSFSSKLVSECEKCSSRIPIEIQISKFEISLSEHAPDPDHSRVLRIGALVRNLCLAQSQVPGQVKMLSLIAMSFTHLII